MTDDEIQAIASKISLSAAPPQERLVFALRLAMATLTDDERYEVISDWCGHCGGPNYCYCMRDD